MFSRFFNRQTNNITSAALLVGIFSLASRVLGIVRDRILASQFGASATLDIYYSAFRIPDLIYNLLILGALSAGFIPVLTGLIKDFNGDSKRDLFNWFNKPAWDLVSNLLNSLFLILLGLSILGEIFTPQLIRVISPGFSPADQLATVKLTRIMFLSPIFLGLSGVLGGVLQSFKNFLIYSLAPIMYNVGIIIGAWWLVPIWGVTGLAWGVALGAILHFIIQLPAVLALGYRYRLFINWGDTHLRQIARMMVPRTLSLAISQINLLVITIIASVLPSGSLAVFNFANNLQSFPVGIFGISFAVAAFPVLSQFAFNQEKLIKNFSVTVRQILFFIIPATILIITLRAQIIRVILGAGNFNWEDTVLTMNALGFFALSLFAQALVPLLTRVFYARHDSRTPLYVGFLVVVVNVLLSLFLSKKMGVAGLALAFSLGNILNFILLWLWLWAKLGDLDQKRILVSVLKFSAAGIGCGFMVQGSKVLFSPYVNMHAFWGVATQGLASGLIGLLGYIIFCHFLKTEELGHFLTLISHRLPWRRLKVDDQGEVRGL